MLDGIFNVTFGSLRCSFNIHSRQNCSDNYIKQVKLLLAGQQTSAQNHFTALYQQLSAFIYRVPVTFLWLKSWYII